MKIRTGFVSNSSSSSYVIALNKINACPHCGRGDDADDFIRLCQRAGDCDTEVRDIQDRLDTLETEIRMSKNTLKELQGKQDTDLNGYNNKIPVGNLRKCAKEAILRCSKEIDAIANRMADGKKVYYLEIDDHNETLNHMFDTLVKSGAITILL